MVSVTVGVVSAGRVPVVVSRAAVVATALTAHSAVAVTRPPSVTPSLASVTAAPLPAGTGRSAVSVSQFV